jgi:hypothetical protein
MFKTTIKIAGVLIMLLAFPIIPDHYPWYYEIVFFNLGLVLLIAAKWKKLMNELGITKSETNQ